MPAIRRPVYRRRDVFITAERVKRGKPEPDAFLLGAELLGLAPAECVVVEDAAAGVLAGLNAGSHVIAVNVPAESPRLEEADFVLNTLTAIDVSKASDGVVTVSLKM
jgi:Predicted phosphatase/phosphohexomutase